jgi:hypothetical protein
MAAIDTLTGVAQVSDNFYEVTSVVDLGSGIDDVTDATFLMKEGGLLRYRNGCTTTFTRCTFIESETAQGLGANNFDIDTDNLGSNTGQARWFGSTCSPVFKGCQWQCTTINRSDFDVSDKFGYKASPSFIKDEYGNYCKVTMRLPEGVTYAQFNHFASDLITIDGLIIDHQIAASGAFEFAQVPADVNQMKDIVIVDNHEGDPARHVVLLGYNVPDNESRTIKGLGCRNIALFGGGFDYTIRLVDPVGRVRKADDASESNDGRLQGFRTFQGNTIDASNQTALDSRVIYYTRTDSTDIHFDNTDSSFSVELMEYEETWDSNELDTSMNDYTERIAAYGYLTQTNDFVIASTTDPNKYNKGSVLMFENPNVTDSQSTAEAYTEILSATEIYDGLHYYNLTRQDNVSYVGVDEMSINGSELDFGSYDVVIDPTLDLPYPIVSNPTGQTFPAGVSGTYIIDLIVNNSATPNPETTVTFTDLNAESRWDSATRWRLGNFVFNDDGTKAYVHGFRDDDDRANIVLQYNLSTAYDLSTKTLAGSFEDTVNGQSGFLSFKPDGTRMYLSKRWGTHYQVDVPTPWELSSIVSPSWTAKTMNSREAGHAWNSDGTKYFTIDDSRSNYENRIKVYEPSTPWDITTITQWVSTTYNFGNDGWSRSSSNDRWLNTLQFLGDGDFILVFNAPTNKVWTYKLPAPYDLNGFTLSANDAKVIGTTVDEVYSPFVEPTQNKMYYVEPRDRLFDDDQEFNIFSVPANLPTGYAGTAGTVYIKSNNIAQAGGINTLVTTGNVTLQNGATSGLTIRDASGFSLSVDVSNIVEHSWIQLYNVTQDAELANEAVVGTSYAYSYQAGVSNAVINTGDVIRLRLTNQPTGTTTACDWYENTTVATDFGVVFQANQVELLPFPSLGVIGSSVTEFTLDANNIEVDLNDPDGLTQKRRFVAWFYYITANSADGIRSYFKGLDLLDSGNCVINQDIVDLKMDNIGTQQVIFNDYGFYLYRKDNSDWVKFPSSGNYGITSNSGKVFVAETGVSGLTSLESTQLFAIPTTSSGGATAEEIREEIDTNSTKLSSIETTVNAIPTNVYTIPDYSSELSTLQTSVNAIPTTTPVIPNYDTELSTIQTSINAIPTTVPSVPTPSEISIQVNDDIRANLNVINQGVKKASKLIPHSDDLQN